MTRFVAEGRAVVNVLSVMAGISDWYFRPVRQELMRVRPQAQNHDQWVAQGLQAVRMKKGGLKVKQWSGTPESSHRPFPINWIGICIAAPLLGNPTRAGRTGGTIADIGTMKAVACATWVSTTTIEQWTYGKTHQSG